MVNLGLEGKWGWVEWGWVDSDKAKWVIIKWDMDKDKWDMDKDKWATARTTDKAKWDLWIVTKISVIPLTASLCVTTVTTPASSNNANSRRALASYVKDLACHHRLTITNL